MVDITKAQQLILDATPVMGRERVPLLKAVRRVLAENVIAEVDIPDADISAVDGYAICHNFLKGASLMNPVKFKIIGEAPAGRPCDLLVEEHETVRIMTGAILPKGTDTVIKMEKTTELNGAVICRHDPGCGKGIRFQGDSINKGDVVLCAGDTVRSLEVCALASLRRAYVTVHRKPIVAIVSTGDELLDFHEIPTTGKIMCSNQYALAAQVIEVGATPLCMGIVPDNIDTYKIVLSDALHADVIITSGGTSKGKYDLAHEAFAAFDFETLFSNFFIKPCKPTVFGLIKKTLIFSLPGNPSATMLSFEQFIRPALLKMMGHLNITDDAQKKSEMQSMNSLFASFDSFNRDSGGNKAHHLAPQVPLERIKNRKMKPYNRQAPQIESESDCRKVSAC